MSLDISSNDIISIENVLPNPVANEARIVLNIIDGNVRQVELKLFHSVGYEVAFGANTRNVDAGRNEIEINLEQCPTGAYFLVVTSGNSSATYPVQVIR